MRTALFAALAIVACSKSAPPPDDNPAAAVILDERTLVKTGPIGTSDPVPSSYAFVDVKNDSTSDRLVTIDGQLMAEGKPVAALGADELRIPAGGTRTFALVADRAAPDSTAAKVKVVGALAVGYPPQIELSDEQQKKGDLLVATAKAKNVVDRTASVVLACTFYDAAGKILSRPFTVVDLAAGATQQLRFEGPRESERAVIFVGQVAFKQ
jgi:hypothetical protein